MPYRFNPFTASLDYYEVGSGGGGATTFLGLSDTPSSYAGQSLKAVRVKADESGLEFYSAAGGHDPVSLDANADTLLSLFNQQLGLDTQQANKVFAGPTSGAAAVPTFRSLVVADIPDLSSIYSLVSHNHNLADLSEKNFASLTNKPTTLAGYGITDAQPLNANLTSISSLGTAADRIIYTTGINTWAETTLTSFARSLLDDTDAATARDTLGIDSILNNLVPYTGATADLDLGNNALYAPLINIVGGEIAFYNQDNTLGLGSLSFDGYSNLNIRNLQTGWIAILETSNLSDNRTFYFPDDSGTFALLESDQTFTGIKTFNNNIQLGEVSLLLDDSISADGKWSGIAEAGTLGEACSFGDLVYFKSADSKWYLANANNVATSGNVKLGICLLAGSANSNTTILLYGKVRASTTFPTMTVGAPQYVSTTAGDIQGTPPNGTDNVIRIVGFANTSSELFFCPENSYLTHT